MPASSQTSESPTFPEELRPLFWDCDVSELRWPADREFVTGRILAAGSWQAIQWLRRTAGDDGIRRWIHERSGRGLSPQQLRFWELILGLSKADVDAWLATRSADPWERRRIP